MTSDELDMIEQEEPVNDGQDLIEPEEPVNDEPPYAEYITLADGTVLEGHILENGDWMTIFVRLTGLSLAHGYMLFSNAENIAHIVTYNHGTVNEYDGFTNMTAINTDFGNCNITLKKVM